MIKSKAGAPILADPRPRRFLRLSAVMDRTGKAESTIYADMAAGAFPKSFPIGSRARAWDERDIDSWQDAKLAQRDKAKAARDEDDEIRARKAQQRAAA